MTVNVAQRKAVFHPGAQDEYDEILAYLEIEAPAVAVAHQRRRPGYWINRLGSSRP